MSRVDVGNGLWYDPEEERKNREFFDGLERQYWNYHFSGKRTVDLFGESYARIVLDRQTREDRKLVFNHKSRGKWKSTV